MADVDAMINLTIDGKAIQTQAGKTILEAARENGITIPTLCYHPRLLPIGSCRLCIVEIEGAERPMTACTTQVQAGIVVHTQTEQLHRMRCAALQLILTYHPLDCPQCAAGGACELQDLVFALGIDTQPYQAARQRHEMREFATPLIRQWGDRCVMCLRCVRADHEIVRTRAIDLAGTGIEATVGITNPDACISCGECLQACPVGALTEHVSRVKARPWQCRQVPTTCPFCSLGCRLVLTCFEDQVIKVTGERDRGVNSGSLCQRGIFGYDFLHHPLRVPAPMIKRSAQWKGASWDEACAVIAERIIAICQEHGPEAVGGLISPRATNEEVYLFQRFMREVVGTNNIDSTGRLALQPYLLAVQEVMGKSYLPYPLAAIAGSDCVVVAGGDLDADNHLIAANHVREAQWRHGARLIVLHPWQGRLAAEADCWFPLRPGDEGTWALGVIHLLLKTKEIVATGGQIKGFAELKEAVKGFTPVAVAKELGCSTELIEEAAHYLAQAKRPAFLCSSPLGQGPNGADQIKALVNLALLSNAFADGGGFHFVGPQSNMVGVVEMGASPLALPGYHPVVGKGLSAVEQFQAAAQGRLKALFVIGEDPLITLPQAVVATGVKGLELLVVQDMFLSETARQAHVFLPALSFAEQDGTFTNCEGRVQRLRRAGEPPAEGARRLGEVLSAIASLMGKEMSALSPAAAFAEITQTNPLYQGMVFEPATPQWRGGGCEGLLDKAAFVAIRLQPVPGTKGYPFSLSLEGIFESHLIGSDSEPRAAGLAQVSRSYLAINAEEATSIGLVDGARARILTPWGEAVATIKASQRMRRDAVVFVLSFYDVAVARLVGPEIDPQSLVPAYAGIPARVEKA